MRRVQSPSDRRIQSSTVCLFPTLGDSGVLPRADCAARGGGVDYGHNRPLTSALNCRLKDEETSKSTRFFDAISIRLGPAESTEVKKKRRTGSWCRLVSLVVFKISMLNFMGVINGTAAIQTNVSCTCNCKRSTSFQSMEITQLEFVQILVIVMVMMVMVVVITCVLNRYRRSARSLLSRHGPQRRPHLPLASEGGLWSSEGAGPSSGQSEQAFTPRPPERVPSYLQRELGRFQPTYPYLPQSLIDLPPTISLSDGEEPPPYQGPCTLQLRDPEQQLELNRESVRAPPNRTVYDSHLLDSSHCPQAPPHLNPGGGGGGVMATTAAFGGQGARVHGAPPTYSEVIGHYYHPSSLPPHPHQTGGPPHPPSLLQGLLPNISPPPGSLESRNARNSKEKQKPQQV
ncbi:protein TMEPAI isoform X2 [Osmerus eperlanus]|uniref:protein TMEPAI isoform X2 n=1 Tax=Osmerus eperlanus TaxID=29151 RepID=UPI002E13B088